MSVARIASVGYRFRRRRLCFPFPLSVPPRSLPLSSGGGDRFLGDGGIGVMSSVIVPPTDTPPPEECLGNLCDIS